jgi:hypothetical protein
MLLRMPAWRTLALAVAYVMISLDFNASNDLSTATEAFVDEVAINDSRIGCGRQVP